MNGGWVSAVPVRLNGINISFALEHDCSSVSWKIYIHWCIFFAQKRLAASEIICIWLNSDDDRTYKFHINNSPAVFLHIVVVFVVVVAAMGCFMCKWILFAFMFELLRVHELTAQWIACVPMFGGLSKLVKHQWSMIIIRDASTPYRSVPPDQCRCICNELIQNIMQYWLPGALIHSNVR